MLVLLDDHALATCNRSSDCSCLHSRGLFFSDKRPSGKHLLSRATGDPALSPPSPRAHWIFVLILVNHVHKWPPRVQASQGNMRIQTPPHRPLAILQGSPTHLSASTATTPKSIFHPTATMIFLTIKSVYIFPLLKHSYVTSRLSRKWKLLPSACKVLGTQPVLPLYLISCHLSSLLLCSTTVLYCCPSEIPCLVSLQALCTCYLLCVECFVASCYPYLSSKATY